MVAKVISGKDIQGAINYNERKVQEGVATLIHASGFLNDASKLSFYDKLSRFTNLHDHNHRTKTNTLHISLNFDPSEKLGEDTLCQIANEYMEKIGFGEQPYLVYEHKDAAHPHVHIVTSIIQERGKRIPIHFLGRNQSEKARKEIENEFGLVKASSKKQGEAVKPIDIQKAVYGKSETRRSISNIVRFVSRTYKYTSLPELNAALKQYNVTADRGTERSRMFQKGGLIYSLIDSKGNRVGIPVKASAIYNKPTLAFLEKQFKLNDALRQISKGPLKKIIDEALVSKHIVSRQQFIRALKDKGTEVMFRSNAEGRIYGVTFVDNNQKTVFNGSALGKQYSANGILEILSAKSEAIEGASHGKDTVLSTEQSQRVEVARENTSSGVVGLIKDLISAEAYNPVSPEAALGLNKGKKKKKRRRRI